MGGVVSLADVRARVADGIANLWSRLGTGADRNSRSYYFAPILSQQQIEAAYRGSWLARKVHDLVPYEMTRAARDWQAEQDQIETLEAAEIALGVWPKLEEAIRTARLHGGAALVLGIRQGMPDQPVNVEALGKGSLRYIFVASRFQLHTPEGFDTDPESDFFMQPAMWEMRGQKGNRVRIHPSRVIPFKGSPLPPGSLAVSQIDQFWGDPLLLSIKSAIDNAETGQAAVATLLHELKQDVISIPGLTEQLATEGGEILLAKRIEAISRLKSMFSALLLDGGDGENEHSGETWETRELSFTQHPELLRTFLGIVAGAADIPVTRLMGESPGGLQSTGKGEQDDFNRMIASQQTARLAPQLARLDEPLIRSALGSRPAEIYYEFTPLADPDPKEESENDKRDAETVEIYSRTGLIPSDALAKAAANRMNESGRWPGLDKAIEESPHELGEDLEEGDDEGLPEPANENDVKQLERRGTVTRDQAMALLTDASPRSLIVKRRVVNAAEIIDHFKAQGLETTIPATDLHVTIVFSRAHVDWMKVAEYDGWGSDDDGKLALPPGGPRIVERFGTEGPVVQLFHSTRLVWRHEEFVRNGASHEHPDYQPHITITYEPPEGFDVAAAKPWLGRIVLGPEIFTEVDENWRGRIAER